MGYFSNGTEWALFKKMWCAKCQHWPENPVDSGCAVWLAHMIYSYDFCNQENNPLDVLIPRSKEGNEKCEMFLPRQGKLPGEQNDV